jgi:hypothetical protein
MDSSLAALVSILFLLLLGAGAAAIVLLLKLGRVRADAHRLTTDNDALRQRMVQLEYENAQLVQYRPIVDVEQYINQRRFQSEQYVAQMTAEGQRVVQSAEVQAATIRTQALQNASAIADNAKAEAEQARQAVVRDAEEAQRLQSVVAALKNVIGGYGTQYVLPTAGLLDGLAEEFGFDEAGQKLKEARDASRAMVKNGSAGLCDYVEANRATTAIAFVVDAFNGKVDTILSDIRHDNYGTLRQKIHDSFHLVNQLGAAFRNARINPEYLQSRLLELKWGTTAQELKLRQREEQRLLKEKIREEERAQREFERARKEALKEEEMLTKALEKARKELEKAGDAQRAKYEQQISELAERLHVAEERNERALSMAQQTRSGHVYVISNVGSFGDDVFKIGMTRRLEPLDRVRELGDASVPFEFDVHALIPNDDAPALEAALHKRFVSNQVNKVNARKEFFRVNLGDIRQEVERLGIPASWTLEAECRQFRETQAIERAMASNQFDVQAWAQTQFREHDKVIQNESIAEIEA